MKLCKECKEEKDFNKFNKSSKSKDGLSSWCKECVRERSKRFYQDNIQQQKFKANERTKRVRKEFDKLKENKKCEKCGYNKYMCVLDFHHLDPSKKEFEISKYISKFKRNDNKLIEEIRKCIVLCSNCHKVFHYLERMNNITIWEFLTQKIK